MNIKERIERDVLALISRAGEDDLVHSNGTIQDDKWLTAIVIPTLAEHGHRKTALRLAEKLADLRDEVGGWDDPWLTVFALEAFEGLSLRQIETEWCNQVIKQAVDYLRGTANLDSGNHELRLARAVVLAGLSLQETTLIDAGLLRAQGVVETGWDPGENIEDALHGMLALADLNAISQDDALKDLLQSISLKFNLSDVDSIFKKYSPEICARIGIVVEKAGTTDLAERYLNKLNVLGEEELDSASLKYRIELAGRLLPKKTTKKTEKNQVKDQRSIEDQASDQKEKNSGRKSVRDAGMANQQEMAARGTEKADKMHNTAIILFTEDETAAVLRTLQSLYRQTSLPDEILLVQRRNHIDPSFQIPEVSLRSYHPDPSDTTGTILNHCLALIAAPWVMVLSAGSILQPEGLEKTINSLRMDEDAAFIARYPGELQDRFEHFQAKPTIPLERIVWNADSLRRSGFMENLSSLASWEMILRNMDQWKIKEINGFNDLYAASLKRDFVPIDRKNILRELPIVFQSHPVESSEIRNFREQYRRSLEQEFYESCRQKGKPYVSIIIPHFNLPEMLKKCIISVLQNTDGIPFEIIVVDNGSSNTDEALIGQIAEWGVRLIMNPFNEGFASACNLGAEWAKGEYLVLLNNDTEVQKGWLKGMVDAMHRNPDAGIVGNKLLFPDGTIQHAGIAFDNDFLPVHIYSNAPKVLETASNERRYQAVTAACMLIEKNLYRRLGGMDEGFLNSFEDVDLCLRAGQLGAGVIYTPQSEVIHHSEQTEGRKRHDHRNIQRFLSRWSGKLRTDYRSTLREDGYMITVKEGKTVIMAVDKENRASSSAPDPVQLPASDDKKAPESTDKTRTATDLTDLLHQADLLIKGGQFSEAEQVLEEGQNRVNGNLRKRALFWTMLGDARFRLDRADEAYECYQKAVKSDASTERAWVGIGAYKLFSGDLEEAEDIFRKVIELSPQYGRGYLGLGNVFLRRGENLQAIDYFKEAVRLIPDHRPAIVGLVAAAVQAGKMMEAKDPLEQYLQYHADDIEARFHLAAILFGGNEVEEAKREVERVLSVKPDHRGANELLSHMNP